MSPSLTEALRLIPSLTRQNRAGQAPRAGARPLRPTAAPRLSAAVLRCGALVLTLGAAPLALAAPPAPPPSRPTPEREGDVTCPPAPSEPQGFEANIESATRCYRAGDFARAIAAWSEAYQQQPAPRILYNLGRSHHRAGHDLEALVMYERYLQAEPASVRRAEVEAYTSELRARLRGARLALPLPTEEPSPQAQAQRTPLYKRWWLWTVVGGVVAAGAVTGAVLGTRAATTPDYPNYRSLTF